MHLLALTFALAFPFAPTGTGMGDAKLPGLADQTVPERYRGRNVINKPKGFSEKVVALTFDDGPDPSNTPKVLTLFAKYNGHTTFFVIGSYAKRQQALLRVAAKRGHVIGSHTWSHSAKPTAKKAGPEIWMTAKTIHDATGVWPSVFRPPYGITGNLTSKVARQDRYGVIVWNRSSADTAHNVTSDDIFQNVIGTQPGDIVLMHDGPGKSKTIKALPSILQVLDRKGYKFITVPDMLRRWDAFETLKAQRAAAKKAGAHAK